MMKLLYNNVWETIAEQWRQSPRYIACAYFSSDRDLSFSKDDVLVVDASDESIKTGRTDAALLRRAYESGASIYSLESLHSKIYVLGTWVAVGSANSSESSRIRLFECMGTSTDARAVSAGAAYVKAIAKKGKFVDGDFISRLEKINVIRSLFKKRVKKPMVEVADNKTWLVGVYPAEYPGSSDFVDLTNEKVSSEMVEDSDVSWFWWPQNSSRFYKEAKEDDLVVQVWSNSIHEDEKKSIVYRHGTIRQITKEDGVRAKAFHISWPENRNNTAMKWTSFKKAAKKAGWVWNVKKTSCIEIPKSVSDYIYNGWDIWR